MSWNFSKDGKFRRADGSYVDISTAVRLSRADNPNLEGGRGVGRVFDFWFARGYAYGDYRINDVWLDRPFWYPFDHTDADRETSRVEQHVFPEQWPPDTPGKIP